MQVEVNVEEVFDPLLLTKASPQSLTPSLVGEHPDQTQAPDTVSAISWETWFTQWLEQLQTTLPPAAGYELSLRLTTDLEIQDFNAQYRHLNEPTDVLAFAALEVDVPQVAPLQASLPLYLGDIVISVETAQRQAQEEGHSLQEELAWLASHGLLHLLGWDHPDALRLQEMLQEQAQLLRMVGFSPDPEKVSRSVAQFADNLILQSND